MKKIMAATVAALLGVTLASPTYALGTPKVQQAVTWGWEDGADKGHRDFSEDDYDTVQDMPALKVTVTPATLGRRVILEAYDSYTQTWSTELSTRTDASGVAKLNVDPLCTDDFGGGPAWCDHDKTYRIRVLKSGTQKVLLSKPFVVSFVASEVSPF